MSPSASSLRWALRYLRPHRGRIAVLIALTLAEIALRALSPWSLAAIVDHALGSAPPPGWLATALDVVAIAPTDRDGMLVAFVIAGVLIQAAHHLVIMGHGRRSVVAGQGMVRDLREELFAHLQAWALAHHARTPTGDVVHRLEADARCLEQIVFRGLFPLGASVVTLLVMFVVLVDLHPQLALVSLAIVPPLYLWLKRSNRAIGPRADQARAVDAQLMSRSYESFAAIRLVKSHAREDHEVARFASAARASARAWIRVGWHGAAFSLVVGLLTVLGTAAVVLVGGLAVRDGSLTLGTLLLVLAYLGFVYGPLSAIASTTNDLQQAFASARRVRAALAVAPEEPGGATALDAPVLRGAVRFTDVTFGYRPDAPVLDRISFDARPGEMIALVGPSGAGKSTLAGLIARLHAPQRGTIELDRLPIERLRLRTLREQVALVLQDPILMAGTIRDNIRYGRLDASHAAIEQAARAAAAHDFIMALPDGYDTELGAAGAGLSGGQRQRLSIARAFLKDAPILLLDEPTASLDTLSEELIIDALRRLRAGRTTFVVAHRLSTVREADRILVMDAGRIIAAGRHDQLVQTSPLYRQLARELDRPATGAVTAAAG